MELKTKITAEEGKQELFITREFDLPVELVFKAYTDAGLLTQWMGTNVLKLDSHPHGGYCFETSDAKGNIAVKMHGSIHSIVSNQSITRTFEMENAPFGAQLEFLTFEPLTTCTSKLTIHSIYRSVAQRDQLLKLPFAQGLNMAHNRLEDIVNKLK